MIVVCISQIPVNAIAYEKKLILVKPGKEDTGISVTTNAKTFYLSHVQQKYWNSCTGHGA